MRLRLADHLCRNRYSFSAIINSDSQFNKIYIEYVISHVSKGISMPKGVSVWKRYS